MLPTFVGGLVILSGLATGYNPWEEQTKGIGGREVKVSSGKGPVCNLWGYGFSEGDLLLAHRTWPCGTRVLVVNPVGGRSAVGVVADRGPYGAIGKRPDGAIYCSGRGKKGWCVKRPKRRGGREDPGTWRGVADMSPVLRRALGHGGYGRVVLITTKEEIKRAEREFNRRKHGNRADGRPEQAAGGGQEGGGGELRIEREEQGHPVDG